MNIHEHQAKELLRQFGIPTPDGMAAFSVREAGEAVQQLAWAAVRGEGADPRRRPRQRQVQGSRRPARRAACASPSRAPRCSRSPSRCSARRWSRRRPAPSGRDVNRIYVSDGVDIERELYLSALVDRASSRVAFIASAAGGMDIEQVAA